MILPVLALALLGPLAIVGAVPTPTPTLPPKTCIDNCKCTEKYHPGIVQVTECSKPLVVDNTTFSALNKRLIEVIKFKDVIINKIKNNAFRDFPFLEDVIVENCRIGTVENKAFDNIRKVKFTECRFEDAPELFSEKLEELTLANCMLEEVPKLKNLFVLIYLNLSGNYIKDIEVTAFAELFDLEEIILSDNHIVKLPANLFVNNEMLNLLTLDNNPLKYFYLNTSNNLETLSLKNCHLTAFDERSTQKLTSLSELILANNSIKSISSKDFAHMKQLSVLDLSYNNITHLDADVFSGNPELQKIILDGNHLKTLPTFKLNNDAGVYMFMCNNCGLETIDKSTFKDMPAIVYLILSHNNFKNIDEMFGLMRGLKILDISYNHIETISPKAFENNTHLETLNLAGNPLLYINPDWFKNAKAIKKVDASNTNLYKLWSHRNTILPSLKTLLVSNNQLITLSKEDFQVVPHLHTIDLKNNPLRFDEALCKVIDWLEKVPVYPIEYSEALDHLEETLGGDTNGFDNINTWSEFHKKQCPEQVMNALDKIEMYQTDGETEIIKKDKIKPLFSNDDYDYNGDDYDGDDDDEDDNDDDDDEEDNETIIVDPFKNEDMTLLARAPYILSLTSVFLLTALVVLIIAVTMILFILRRNDHFNMKRANLPRFKIPVLNSTPGIKKHSGSVYRPLSEDLSGPKTPKLSRYEFSATPGVHCG